MTLRTLAIVVIFVTNIHLCQSRKYENYTLFKVVPEDETQLSFLKNIEQQKYMDVKFWKRPAKLHEPIQVLVNPSDMEMFKERTSHYKLTTKVLIEDIEKAFENQTIGIYHRLNPESFRWDVYYELDDIYQWLADIAEKYSHIAQLETIGKSVQGRDIYALLIRHRITNGGKVIIEGGVHGHEWISPAFVTYLINKLIHVEESKSADFILIAKYYHWHLIPMVNPDGYLHTFKEDRLWRKNRRIFTASGVGVDLDRNFGYNFGAYTTVKDPRDDYYCGPTSFSEPETKAVADYVNKNRDKLKLYISIHAYGQKVILPYSDKLEHIENYTEMENYARQAIIKMFGVHHVKYGVGTVRDTLGYLSSGDSASWVKKNYKTGYVFTFFIRDDGTYGYALPASLIEPTCEELVVGLTELMTCEPKYVSTDFFSQAITAKSGVEIIVLSICVLFALK